MVAEVTSLNAVAVIVAPATILATVIPAAEVVRVPAVQLTTVAPTANPVPVNDIPAPNPTQLVTATDVAVAPVVVATVVVSEIAAAPVSPLVTAYTLYPEIDPEPFVVGGVHERSSTPVVGVPVTL